VVGEATGAAGVGGEVLEGVGAAAFEVAVVVGAAALGQVVEDPEEHLPVDGVVQLAAEVQGAVLAADHEQFVTTVLALGWGGAVGVELVEQALRDPAQQPRRQPGRGVGQDPFTAREVRRRDGVQALEPGHGRADDRDMARPDLPRGQGRGGVRVARGEQLTAQ